MLIVVSPAKKMDFDTSAPAQTFTKPSFLDKSQQLINALKKCKPVEISKLMKLSDKLTTLNVNRYKKFKKPFTLKNAKQAMFAFKGDTYVGLDAETMSKSQMNYAQKHLRILSGLYGVLAPLDLIQPYRLEMGTKFACNGSKNLYEFWSEALTDSINSELKKKKILVNLASKEYFSAINTKSITNVIVTPTFKEKKNGEYKMIGIFAKRARGMMSRYIIDNKVKNLEDLKNFDTDGYKYSAKLSTETEPVFTRG